MEKIDLVLKTLKDAGKPLKAQEVASIAGIDKADADKAIKELKKLDKVFSPKVCFYSPK